MSTLRSAAFGLLLIGLSNGFAPVAVAEDAEDLSNGLLSACREMVAASNASAIIPDRTTCECLEAGLQALITPESMRGGPAALAAPIEQLSLHCVAEHVRAVSPELCRAGFRDHYEIRTEADRAEVEKVCGCLERTLQAMDDKEFGERIVNGEAAGEKVMRDCGLPEARGKLPRKTAR